MPSCNSRIRLIELTTVNSEKIWMNASLITVFHKEDRGGEVFTRVGLTGRMIFTVKETPEDIVKLVKES